MKIITLFSLLVFCIGFTLEDSFAQVPDMGPSGCVDPRGCDFGSSSSSSSSSSSGMSAPSSNPMDFTVRMSQNGFDVKQCSSYTVPVIISKYRGDNERVLLDATSWAGYGVTTYVSPSSAYPYSGQNDQSDLNIKVSCTAGLDNYPITVRGYTDHRQSNDMITIRVVESQLSLRINGDVNYRSGNYALAAQYYKDATNPNFGGKSSTLSTLYNSAGVAYAKQGYNEFGKISQSKFYFDQALKIDSSNSMAKNNQRIVSDVTRDNTSQLRNLQISLTTASASSSSGSSGGNSSGSGTNYDPAFFFFILIIIIIIAIIIKKRR